MPKVVPKLELLVDLERPVEEIQGCIATIANAHPGKQLDILREVDVWIGETISKLEEPLKDYKQSNIEN